MSLRLILRPRSSCSLADAPHTSIQRLHPQRHSHLAAGFLEGAVPPAAAAALRPAEMEARVAAEALPLHGYLRATARPEAKRRCP